MFSNTLDTKPFFVRPDGEKIRDLTQTIYELKNRTHMRKAIYDQAYSKGAASIAKDQSNIDFDPVRKSTGTETPIPDGLREAFSYINGVK